jgi:CRP-like cAMP-binding protein
MSLSFKLQLANIAHSALQAKSVQREVSRLSPLDAAKLSTRRDLAASQAYCSQLLRGKNAFSGLTDDQIRTIAQSVEKVVLRRGAVLMEQDQLGDRCFILEAGSACMTRKVSDGSALELGELHKDAIMGEMCFFTDEPRPTTITITSEEAKVYVLRKDVYASIIDSTKDIVQDIRSQLVQNVVAKVPIFSNLTSNYKQKLFEAMIPVVFPDGSHICRQGKIGKGFYLITEGKCIITVGLPNETEKRVKMLEAGDYFGMFVFVIGFTVFCAELPY